MRLVLWNFLFIKSAVRSAAVKPFISACMRAKRQQTSQLYGHESSALEMPQHVFYNITQNSCVFQVTTKHHSPPADPIFPSSLIEKVQQITAKNMDTLHPVNYSAEKVIRFSPPSLQDLSTPKIQEMYQYIHCKTQVVTHSNEILTF